MIEQEASNNRTVSSNSQKDVNVSLPTEPVMSGHLPAGHLLTGHNGFGFKSKEACLAKLGPLVNRTDGLFCPADWDTVLCWPAAQAGSYIHQPCPPLRGLLPDKTAFRYCGPEGLWETKKKGVYTNGTGYTDYMTHCYSKEAWGYYVRYLKNRTDQEKEFMKDIIDTSRKLEIAGYCISLVTTVISLVIFCYFRSLKCHRTRIHKNLFVAMAVQIAMRIILYVDQLVARESGQVAGASSGASNALYDKPIFCEMLYSLIEYTKTVKFMWMFVEGIYLHNMIAVSVFSGKPNYILYYLIGWGFPILLTIAWVIPLSRIYETKPLRPACPTIQSYQS